MSAMYDDSMSSIIDCHDAVTAAESSHEDWGTINQLHHLFKWWSCSCHRICLSRKRKHPLMEPGGRFGVCGSANPSADRQAPDVEYIKLIHNRPNSGDYSLVFPSPSSLLCPVQWARCTCGKRGAGRRFIQKKQCMGSGWYSGGNRGSDFMLRIDVSEPHLLLQLPACANLYNCIGCYSIEFGFRYRVTHTLNTLFWLCNPDLISSPRFKGS